jgi:hypothetical protein
MSWVRAEHISYGFALSTFAPSTLGTDGSAGTRDTLEGTDGLNAHQVSLCVSCRGRAGWGDEQRLELVIGFSRRPGSSAGYLAGYATLCSSPRELQMSIHPVHSSDELMMSPFDRFRSRWAMRSTYLRCTDRHMAHMSLMLVSGTGDTSSRPVQILNFLSPPPTRTRSAPR